MRILFLQMFPLFGSGSGTYARELAEELGKRHDIGIVVPDKREIPGVKMYPVSLPVKITFTGHPDWPNSLLYTKVSGEELSKNYLAYFRAIVEAVDDFKPDILHVHHLMLLSWIARFIKIAYKLNFIVTAHGSELPTLENDKRYPFLTAESLRKSVRIVPNSFWTKTWIQKVFGNEFNRKFRVIPGGVDILMFPEEMNTQEVNEKFQLGDRKLILFSGKLTKYKGVKYLLQAARYIDATIGIAGDGPEKKNLQQIVKDLKITNVKFFGLVPHNELIQLYFRADVCVVPSVWDEPLGLVVLEAMAAKTPVVVTRKGGISLMVKDGINGLFVRPRNAREIAEKVNLLLKNDQLRLKIAQKARQTVLDKFTWNKIANLYEEIYFKNIKVTI